MTKTQELEVKDLKEEELAKTIKELDDLVGTVVAQKSGSSSKEFGMMIFNQLSSTCYPKMEITELFSSILENMKNIKPKDHIEGMLAAQMITTHNMIMQCFRRTVGMFDDGQFDVLKIGNDTLNLANKLMRTYTMQMEALNRYRGKGQQKMTVEHVHINSGGQAIIGNVTKNDTSTEGGTRG